MMKQNEYDAYVTKCAKKAGNNFKRLMSFCKKHDISSSEMDRLCSIIDSYSKLNCDIMSWSVKNKIDYEKLSIDVTNSF